MSLHLILLVEAYLLLVSITLFFHYCLTVTVNSLIFHTTYTSGLFSTLATDYEYSRSYRENLQLPIQMQVSELSIFLSFIYQFYNVAVNNILIIHVGTTVLSVIKYLFYVMFHR